MRKLIAVSAALTVGLLAAGDATSQSKERWKLHSSFPLKLPITGTSVTNLAKTVSEASNGSFEIRVYEPGALVPAIQYYDPVSQGSIDAAWGNGGFLVGKMPALIMFASIPFGPRAGEYLAWMKYGGGEQLHDELQAKHNVKPVTCAVIAPESSGWFRKEIKSVDDLKGLKMRFLGLGAKVMERFGVSTQLLAAGDIYPALELGTIDATEFSMPVIDEGLGFHQIAKHNYYPGWHQQGTLLDVIVHKPKYDALSEHHKNVLRIACESNLLTTFVESEAAQFGAMGRMKEKGVTMHRWPEEILATFEKAWSEVVEAEAARDADFKRVYESYASFREQYAVWREMGYVN